MDKPYVLCHIEKAVDFTIFDTRWLPCSAKCVVLGNKPNGKGVLRIFEMNAGHLDVVKEYEYKTTLKCGSFGANSLQRSHMSVISFDGQLQVLDLERLGAAAIYSVEAHKGMATCLDAIGGGYMKNCGAPEIASKIR